MSRAKIPPADAAALRYAGLLGHTFVVLIDDARYAVDGRSAALESCDRKRAIRCARTDHIGRNPRVYQQVSRGTWRAVAS